MINSFKNFNESSNNDPSAGDFINKNSMIILDIVDPIEENEFDYIEYIAYGINDGKFYFLDPDFGTIGVYNSIEDLFDDNGFEQDIDLSIIDKYV